MAYSLCSFLCSFLIFIAGFSFHSDCQLVPAMFVFGDSLVDVGNNNYITLSLAKADFPHNGIDFPGRKATGRFSNGKNAADFLAEKVGLPSSPPYLSLSSISNKSNAFFGGVSFASGGAGILDSTDKRFRSIALNRQIEYYSTVYGELVQHLGANGLQTHLSKSIFGIVIGSNDLLGYFRSGSSLCQHYTPQEFVNLLTETLRGQLKRIYNLGARKFVVVGAPAIGCCPSQRRQNKDSGCNEEANYWALKYNNVVQTILQDMKSELNDMNYSYFDAHSVLLNFIQSPAQYGFNEVKAACCGLGDLNARVPCLPITRYCSNRSDHIFWDLFHPTEAASRIFAETIFNGSKQYVFPINVQQLVAI